MLWQVHRRAGSRLICLRTGASIYSSWARAAYSQDPQPLACQSPMFQPLVSDGWAVGHGDCDGIMKRDDRIVGNLPQQLMEAMICGPTRNAIPPAEVEWRYRRLTSEA